MSNAERNRATLDKIYACFFSGDIAGMCGYLADDVVIAEVENLPYGGDYVGHQGMLDVAAALGGTWDDLALTVDDTLSSETRVAALGTFSGRSKATGERVSFPMCEVWTFREDGKVTRIEPIYGDTAQVRQALRLDAPVNA